MDLDAEVKQSDPEQQTQRNGKLVVAVAVALFVALVAYFALGMPGMDHGGMSDTTHENSSEQDSARDCVRLVDRSRPFQCLES